MFLYMLSYKDNNKIDEKESWFDEIEKKLYEKRP